MFSFATAPRLRAAIAAGAALVTGLFAASGIASAQAQPVDYSQVEAAPALWLITDDDSRVYVFGTFHILPASLDWKTDAVMSALAASDTLYLETDSHSREAQAQMQALVQQYGLNPPGVTLSSLLDDETRALLAEFAPTIGAAPAMLEPMRPWLAEIVLMLGQVQALGFDPSAGVETALIAEIEGTDTAFGYFETPEEQIGFLAGMPEDVQVEALAQGIRDAETMPAEIDGMVRAWATGDMDALDAYVNGDMRAEAPELYETLIVERNENWVPLVEDILDGSGSAFIAVGAAHLPGERGLVALMRAEGYTVTRQ